MNLIISSLNYVPRYIACTVLVICLTACSIGSRDSSVSLPVHEWIKDGEWIEESGSGLQRISESPYVYAIPSSGTSTYLTAIRDCDGHLTGSMPAIARQLFVGLKDIRIEKKDGISLTNNPGVLVIAQASLDDTHLAVATYSVLDHKCLFDVIFWRKKENTPESNTTFAPEELTKFASVVKSLILSAHSKS